MDKNYFSENADVVKDSKGRNVVLIKDKLFFRRQLSENAKYKLVRGTVEEMLLSLSGESVTVKDNGAELYLDENFADEYSNSNDSLEASKPRRNAKMNSVRYIKAIIENAEFFNHEENRKSNKKIDAERGFDYYTIRLGILNGEKNYTIFEGFLNVRLASNNKDYVYDITKISADYDAQVNGSISLSTDNKNIS